MSTRKLAALGLIVTVAAGCGAPAPEPEPAPEPAPEPPQFAVTGEHPCNPVGEVRFLCDMVSPRTSRSSPGRSGPSPPAPGRVGGSTYSA